MASTCCRAAALPSVAALQSVAALPSAAATARQATGPGIGCDPLITRSASGARQEWRPGTRSYLSGGLPGADWWVAGAVVATAEDADVELD
ncbi:MAG: hypothetical protein ABI382_13185, partial [Nakamurella sp.]